LKGPGLTSLGILFMKVGGALILRRMKVGGGRLERGKELILSYTQPCSERDVVPSLKVLLGRVDRRIMWRSDLGRNPVYGGGGQRQGDPDFLRKEGGEREQLRGNVSSMPKDSGVTSRGHNHRARGRTIESRGYEGGREEATFEITHFL